MFFCYICVSFCYIYYKYIKVFFLLYLFLSIFLFDALVNNYFYLNFSDCLLVVHGNTTDFYIFSLYYEKQ